MKSSWLFPTLLLLWQCATPPSPPPTASGDDSRLVSRAEFAASRWAPVPGAVSWLPLPSGAKLQLADGREATITVPAPDVVRWWVPAGKGEAPLSPGAVYGEPVAAKVQETAGILSIDTPSVGVRLKLADLSWTLIRGDAAVVRTAGGPRMAGRRLMQAFAAADTTWSGLGLEKESSAKFWISKDPDSVGSWALPSLFGVQVLPFAVVLDSSYQSYTRLTASEATIGALNGGLDLLISAASQPEDVLTALTGLTGKPAAVPSWSAVTALAMPADETGAFLRQAGLSVATAAGPYVDRARLKFKSVVPGQKSELLDLTGAAARQTWAAGLSPQAGVELDAYCGSQNWSFPFADHSPLARMNNLIPTLQARAASETLSVPGPVWSPTAGPGTVRWANLELQVSSTEGLPRVLALGLAGAGTPAIRLDLSGLADAASRETSFRALNAWLMAPALILDWGTAPSSVWSSLPDAAKKRLKALLDVRSQFLPVFSEQLRRQSATGVPAWRPVWFTAAHDPQAFVNDEFLLGDLLVAPVEGSATQRSVYLPSPGVWFDFWSGEEYGGGRSYQAAFSPDKPIIFVRGGGFVPTRDPEPYDMRGLYNPMTIHVFPGGRGEGIYYYDDGVSAGAPGTFLETRIVYDYSQREMTLEHQSVVPTARLRPEPYILYRLRNVYRPRQVLINDKPIPLYGSSWGVTDSDRSAAWYEDDQTLLIKTFQPEKNQLIKMSF